VGPAKAKKKTSEQWRSALPLLKELVRPRRKLLAFGLFLTIIGQLCSLVLPGSSRYFIDDVIGKGQTSLMKPLILAVLGATFIQAATNFSLTQLLSKEAQRLIAELRRKVQEHVGRLSVAYYDANKSGVLVSRIMSDVEGVRNLVGTGLVDFVGGILKRCSRSWCCSKSARCSRALPCSPSLGSHSACGKPSAAFAPSSASAAKSTPKSPAVSLNPSPAFAS
jgi:ABC-type multidrug transport system fused ATPase/permease subunit